MNQNISFLKGWKNKEFQLKGWKNKEFQKLQNKLLSTFFVETLFGYHSVFRNNSFAFVAIWIWQNWWN